MEGVVKFKIHIAARREGGRGTSFTAGGIGSDVRALMTHSVPSFLFFSFLQGSSVLVLDRFPALLESK